MSELIRIRPEKRLILSMAPFMPIRTNEDGTGGGIQLRVYGDRSEPYFVEVVWGERTEIEILL